MKAALLGWPLLVVLGVTSAACRHEGRAATVAGPTQKPLGSAGSDEILPTPPPFPALTLDEVEAQLGRPGVYLFDANTRELYDRGHLPGATWVVWDDLSKTKLPDDHGALLVFYCANEWCSASHESARLAKQRGYTNVKLMPSGIFGWKKAKKRTEPPTSP